MDAINLDMIKRAEKAVEELASQYSGWAAEDIVKLRGFVNAAENEAASRDQQFHDIHRIAHDMRGQGSTFGFPLITRIAGSLCTYLKRPDEGDMALRLVSAHIDALDTVIVDKVTDELSTAAIDIVDALESAIGKSIA